jgi:hypothetical protein
MKIIKIITLLAITIASFSCSGLKIVVDEDKSIDFSKFTTYSFLGWQHKSDALLTEDDKVALREAFTREFERRGLKRVDALGDMQISLYIVTNSETAYSGYNDYVGGGGGYMGYSHYGYGYGTAGYGNYGTGNSNNSFKIQSKEMGTVIMNVYNGKSKSQVWQAIMHSALNKKQSKRNRSIPSKVSTIMSEFPVKPVTK